MDYRAHSQLVAGSLFSSEASSLLARSFHPLLDAEYHLALHNKLGWLLQQAHRPGGRQGRLPVRTPKPLAAALYQLATVQSSTTLPITANVMDKADGAVMNARFDTLFGITNPYEKHISRRNMAISATFVASTTLLLVITYAAHDDLVLRNILHWIQGFC